jgi:hypothetical protein
MIDQLLRFLPGFEEPNRKFIERWETFYPVYAADVEEFFGLAMHGWWMDTDYQPNEAGRMIYDDDIVQSATLDEIKTMLTYCVRIERFGDGNWGALLADGRIQALLRRLKIIRKELDAA